MSIHVTAEIVKVFEITVAFNSPEGGDTLDFRVELMRDYKDKKKMKAKIWRKEFYRIQPTFPQQKGLPEHEPCDELLLVEETGLIDTETVESDDWRFVLNKIVRKLNERFNMNT